MTIVKSEKSFINLNLASPGLGTPLNLIYSLCNSHYNFNSFIHTIILILQQLVLFVKYFFSSFPFFNFACLFPCLD